MEYASRLCPIADEDLPPALRYAYMQESTDDRPRRVRLLHFGFQCPVPDNPSYMEIMWNGVNAVNEAVGRPRTLEIVTALVARRNTSFVVAAYSNDAPKDPAFNTPGRIERIGRELRKTFGDGVQGPMWYWDAPEHGPGMHANKPFDEAYPEGHPAECW
ncbi:hypothetical protein GSI_09699 [Ganoderma sinense ZZ0214-1]|uniref:Uncharacterized protein n=1 Tax=Ganoderma sinense ZZ0214-1 TaxID=1077348 RepID=A0A2G8S335_9APHY|nr:hypothetical protein GSI_09699 [Ganoderma sinense ZZ0214-1]